MPNDTNGRDSALRKSATEDFTVGPIFENPSLKNLGPRVGFAWDVSGDGKSRFAAAPACTTIPMALSTRAAPASVFAAIRDLGQRGEPDVSSSVVRAHHRRARRAWSRLPDPAAAHDDRNLNLQREVLPRLVITAGYAASRGYNLVQAIEAIQSSPRFCQTARHSFLPMPQTKPALGIDRLQDHWRTILV